MLPGLCFGGEAGARNLVFFCKVVAAGDEKGTSCVLRVRVPPLCSATSGCVDVRSSICFLNLWLQIALEWLRQGCWAPRLHA